jgi:hypothetical protein
VNPARFTYHIVDDIDDLRELLYQSKLHMPSAAGVCVQRIRQVGKPVMRRLALVLCLVAPFPTAAQDVGKLHHITGCENGVLQVPTPNVWSSPQRLLGPQPAVV